MTTPMPAPAPVSKPSTESVVRDVAAVVLILSTIALPWNLTSDGGDHWYVVLTALIACLAPGVTHLAQNGAFGAGWDVGYNRLVRYALVVPWLICLVVVVIADFFGSIDSGFYGGIALDGGVGIGAMTGFAGVLLAVQPRPHERPGPEPTAEDRAWIVIAQVLAGIGLAALVITSLVHQTWDAGFFTVVMLFVMVAMFVYFGLPLVGVISRSAPWIVTAAAMTALIVLVSLLTLGDDGSLGGGFTLISSGESVHLMGYGLLYFVGASTAAIAPCGDGLIAGLTTPDVLRGAAARFLLLLSLIAGAIALMFIALMVQFETAEASIIIATLLAVVASGATAVGAQQLWRPGPVNLAVISVGIYVASSWVMNIVAGTSQGVSFAFVDYLQPVIAGVIVLTLALGPRQLLSSMRQTVQGFATQPPGQAAAAQVPAAQTPTAESAPHQAPSPRPATPATPQAEQDWGDLATPVATAPPAPPLPPPAPVADPILDEAADPATPLARLAEIVSQHPHARAAVAANPSAYPDLLAWLAQTGDPAVTAALRARTPS